MPFIFIKCFNILLESHALQIYIAIKAEIFTLFSAAKILYILNAPSIKRCDATIMVTAQAFLISFLNGVVDT